jgi:hypothetical protein
LFFPRSLFEVRTADLEEVMRHESVRALERLAVADSVDSSWLCCAARALDQLDESLARLEREADGPEGGLAEATRRSPRVARAVSRARADRVRLHDQARSLRRRLVLATKDARVGLELKAELMTLSCDASSYFRRVRRVMWESFATSAQDNGPTPTFGKPGVVA